MLKKFLAVLGLTSSDSYHLRGANWFPISINFNKFLKYLLSAVIRVFLSAVICGLLSTCYAEDAEIKLNSNDGSTGFIIQDKDGATVYKTDSDGNTVVKGTMTVQGSAFSVGGSTLVIKGGNVGIGTTSPGAKLEVNGTMKVFGAREAQSLDVEYTAATDGFVVATITQYQTSSYGAALLTGVVDGTTRAGVSMNDWGGIESNSFTMPVRKGEKYKVTRTVREGATPSVSIYWVPLGL